LPHAAGLYYEVHGGGSELPPLVFLHGAGGNRLLWPVGLRRLAGCRAYTVDLPGHGRSPAAVVDSIAGYADRVAAWREAAGVSRPLVVGHSMGSAVALTWALDDPKALAGLALIGAGPRLPVNPALLEGASQAATFPSVVDQILAWSFSRQAPRRLVDLVRRRMLEAGPTVLFRDLQACNAFDVLDRLGEIRVPTLLVVGTEDRMTPPRLSEALLGAMPRARLERVESAGHMVMLEQPEAVGEILLASLKGQLRPG
jgi:pimeloyl-ACP methyl ester carboxylesterase